MIQIIMLVVGVVYLVKLMTMNSAGMRLGLPPEVLAEWRGQRQKQYLWGIAAGWGSLVVGLIVLYVVTQMTRSRVPPTSRARRSATRALPGLRRRRCSS